MKHQNVKQDILFQAVLLTAVMVSVVVGVCVGPAHAAEIQSVLSFL